MPEIDGCVGGGWEFVFCQSAGQLTAADDGMHTGAKKNVNAIP